MIKGGQKWYLAMVGTLLFFPICLSAQLSAGSWLADASGEYRYASLRQSGQTLHEYGFSGDFHFFPLQRLSLGAHLGNTYVALNSDFFQSSSLLFYIEPNLRYYFLKGRFPFFLQAGFYWQRQELSQVSGVDDNVGASGRGGSAAAGVNLFVRGSACLEGLLEYRYRELEEARLPGRKSIQRSLALGARLRVQLSEQGAEPAFSGPGLEAVKSGGWMAGGRVGGALFFGDPGRYAVAVNGGIFLVDRFAIGLSLEVEGAPNGEAAGEGDFSRSAAPFLRYYFPINDNMLFFPAVGYSLGKSDSITPFGFESFSFNTWRLGMGLDNFLSDAFALELLFSLSGRNVSPASAAATRDFDLSFGLTVGVLAFW